MAINKKRLSLIIMCIFMVNIASCGKNNTQPSDSAFASDTSILSEQPQPLAGDINVSEKKGTRDNTPLCLVPSADNIITYGNDSVTVDASHTEKGFVMVQYHGSVSKVKLQITGSNKVTYTYDLTSEYAAFPLISGNGNYVIAAYENIKDDQYATVYEHTIAVDLENEFLPYLYANQYVRFDDSSASTKLASELAYSANSELDVVTNVYNYIISNITYDYEKAGNVQNGYIPDIDTVLSTKSGICFDYASLMAAMLRSQQIPTRLEVGYAGESYHAWISTYIADIGWVNGMIEFDGKEWTLMDPTFAANSSERSLKEFIGNGSNYMTKYIY